MTLMRACVAFVVIGLAVSGLLPGCGGGTGVGPFSTSVPGNKPLGSLTPAEADRLCQDRSKFISESTLEMDACRISAYITTRFQAESMTALTDAELRMSCTDEYGQCATPDPGGGPVTCDVPPAGCAATVSELVTCINDQTAQFRGIASQLPNCDAVTRAGLAATVDTTPPASCLAYLSKCAGIPDAANEFAAQYCALVDPCCTAAGVGSQCAGLLAGAAFEGPFDATAAAACLEALRQRQAGPDFCGGLAVVRNVYNSWAVAPECAAVFATHQIGSTPPGEVCTADSACAPGPNGGAVCVYDIFRGTSDFSKKTCVQITATVSDGPCIGTGDATSGSFTGTADAPAQGVFCDKSKGVICDDATHRCVPVHGLGEACQSTVECDDVTQYCNFAVGTPTCAARLPIGATCVGMGFGECDGKGYCNDTTKQCTAPKAPGAVCTSSNSIGPECLAGYCNNGICPSQLGQVCLPPAAPLL